MTDFLIVAAAVVLAAFTLFYAYVGVCVIGFAVGGAERWGAGIALIALGAVCGYGFLTVAAV